MSDMLTGPAAFGDESNTLLLKIATALQKGLSPGVARTLTTVAATASGSVAAGAKSVVFSSSSDFAGTIAGATFPPSTSITLNASFGDALAAIAYTRSAGTLNIFSLA